MKVLGFLICAFAAFMVAAAAIWIMQRYVLDYWNMRPLPFGQVTALLAIYSIWRIIGYSMASAMTQLTKGIK